MRGTSASPAGGSPGCSRVHVGVVDKHAGLHIALGVDVEIPPAAGDAAAHVLRVILEVHGEDGLRAAEGPDVLIHLRALLRRPALALAGCAHGCKNGYSDQSSCWFPRRQQVCGGKCTPF